MTEPFNRSAIIGENGAITEIAPDFSKGGFDVGDGWDGYWTFEAAGGGSGTTPMPSQTKIDNFQRKMAKLFVDLDVAERQAREAREKAAGSEAEEEDTRSAEEMMAEVEEALKLKREVFDAFRDALANVCSDSPSRAELGKLNEPNLIRFINHVGKLLNPEV